MTFSYNEEKLLSEILWVAIVNGNSATPKAFDPTPDQYQMICEMVNRLDANIKQMQKDYGLD